ncbi:MAG: hypothetical protein O7D91_21475 [Planctomycetota bacterium]|nr:hypothetical protein [Planctomycetota bacterium]
MTSENDSQPVQEKKVPAAVQKLEKLSLEAAELVDQLHAAFSCVLSSGPSHEQTDGDGGQITGSDLGRTLLGFADRIENSFHAIRDIIKSADL